VHLAFHEVDESRWDDFERLFASRGGPKSCWCMVWRATGIETRQTKGLERKAAIEARVRNKVPIGILRPYVAFITAIDSAFDPDKVLYMFRAVEALFMAQYFLLSAAARLSK
jgi:hypothetical protein